MNDQKIENLLNLALDATEVERERSLELDVGFDDLTRTWELIVKYSGDIGRLARENEEITVVEMLNNFAVVTVPEHLIDRLADQPEIEYIEKPKRLFFAVNQGRTASCIPPVQNERFRLFGQGVLVAVIDSGIDYTHPDFRNEDGTTRIVNLWDQTVSAGPAPEGYLIGTEYSAEQINEALQKATPQEQYAVVPSRDLSGHGTHVAGIAAGNGRASSGVYKGVASQSELLIVKLGNPRADSFPRTTELMQAVDYVVRKSIALGTPAAINISFGNTYGSHSGTSLIETYLNNVSNLGRTAICVGTGNEGAAAGHTQGVLTEGNPRDIEFSISNNETAMNLQIWKSYVDEVNIAIVHPSGMEAGPIQPFLGPQRFVMGGTELLLYYGEPSPYSIYQEIYIDFLPREQYLDSGIWKIRLVPERIVSGRYDMWMPSEGALNTGTRFLTPTENITLTIPSTASGVISVGAYDSRRRTYAAFSGRGYTWMTNQPKPDLVAPGVDIMSAAPGGGYTSRSGTSMATPFVSGSAALLMQWGIVNGNDLFLYGEKLKAYLQRGARELPGFTEYPNSQVGYGALCVRDSLPV
ncbi:S8 family serine peptidase [Lachnospiraceae bacterium ASD3451]|uniref:S8 family peptidase n=1 Tax=Diplocloster agilis TaxID=2850323 RepID=UPI001D57BA00|nr:S8 family peptidase [Diplocloster agilis]MBU9744369.1 S8 family serine peptidase [Diplocloster agilis]